MKPVYFPHTFVPDSASDILRNLFPSLAVYQPTAGYVPEEMRPLVESGFLELVVSSKRDSDDVERFIRGFEEWGRLHRDGAGLEAALRHGSALGAAFDEEDGFYSIATQLKRQISSPLTGKTAATLLTARIFLHLAQMADQQRHQLAVELSRYERAQAELYEALKGRKNSTLQDFESAAAVSKMHDLDDRVDLRLAAWARVFLNHPYPSPVFVTPSAALIRLLSETREGGHVISLPDLARACGSSLSGHRLCPEGLLLLLGDLAAGRISLPEKAASNLQGATVVPCVGAVHVYVWFDVSPFVFFSRPLSNPAPMGDPSSGPLSWRHTIVVHIHGPTKTTSRLDTPI